MCIRVILQTFAWMIIIHPSCLLWSLSMLYYCYIIMYIIMCGVCTVLPFNNNMTVRNEKWVQTCWHIDDFCSVAVLKWMEDKGCPGEEKHGKCKQWIVELGHAVAMGFLMSNIDFDEGPKLDFNHLMYVFNLKVQLSFSHVFFLFVFCGW